MNNFDKDFIKFVISCNALQYGKFTLKDGSESDVYFNTASFDTGLKIKSLARFFAHKIFNNTPNCNLIYGSAYKGIPLATAVAMELGHMKGTEVGYLFNRKEEKKHGDKGIFIGKMPKKSDEIVFVDDVITSGRTKEDGIRLLLDNFGASIAAILVAVDRRNEHIDISDVPVQCLATLDTIRTFYQRSKNV